MDILRFLQDEAFYRTLALIIPLVAAVIALYGTLAQTHQGQPLPFARRLIVVIPLLALFAFILVPFAYSFYNRSQQKSFEFRMKRSSDVEITKSILNWKEELETLNGGLHFTKIHRTSFILADDAYTVTELQGQILPSHKHIAEAHNFYLPYITESQQKPRELFFNAQTKSPIQPIAEPSSISPRGTKGRWRLELPEDNFAILTIINYPGAMSRRGEPDYIFLGLFYQGGVEKYDFSVVFDSKIYLGDMGLFRVEREWGVIRLLDIPLHILCQENLSPLSNKLQTINSQYPGAQARLRPLIEAFQESKLKQSCTFSLGNFAKGLFSFAFRRPA